MKKPKPVPEALKEVASVKFYEEKSIFGPVYTVCLLISSDGNVLSRGVSICSMLENFKKSKGRDKARGRAERALIKRETSMDIQPYDGRFDGKYVSRKITIPIDDPGSVIKYLRKFGIDYYRQSPVDNYVVGCVVPLEFPVVFTNKSFSYKSEYKPELTEKELRIVTRKRPI